MEPRSYSLLDARTCWAVLAHIATYLAQYPDSAEWLDLLGLLVKHGSAQLFAQDRDLLDYYESPLLSYVEGALSSHWPYRWNVFVRKAQSACRQWLQLLVNTGLALELYGKCECSFLTTKRYRPMLQPPGHPAIELARPILALSYGPAVSDWYLWLDCPYDQWAGDFWNMLEHGSTVSVPGAWFDEDEERAVQLRGRPGEFNSLATSRRKRKRYLSFMQMNDDDARIKLGPHWGSLAYVNGKLRKDGAPSGNWRNWPPLVADVDNPSLDEWGRPEYPKKYCSVCKKWTPLLAYYHCRPDIAGGISAGMCHGGDHDVLEGNNET